MDEKKTFGAYIRRKRQSAGLTQRDLAQALYVTESTVSKWERGLSYPDVSLVTAICRELGISEHEFFTACDDDGAAAQARAAAVWNGVVKGVQIFFAAAYAAALIPCFICNLAFDGGLTWFWIVFASLALAFCLTNLPFLVRKDRLAVCMGAASGCLLLLLLACWGFTGGYWVGGAMAITAVCLALPWGVWAVWRFYGRHVAPLAMGILTLWVPILLAVICLFSHGDWLLGFAYPIAAYGLAFLWLLFAALYWLPAGPWLKAGVCALLVTFVVPLGNCLSNAMMPEQKVPVLSDYFAWGVLFTQESVNGFSWVNVLVFAVMLLCSAALLAVGVALELRRLRRRRGSIGGQNG